MPSVVTIAVYIKLCEPLYARLGKLRTRDPALPVLIGILADVRRILSFGGGDSPQSGAAQPDVQNPKTTMMISRIRQSRSTRPAVLRRAFAQQ
jgi:hypothetical protein